MEPIEIGYLKAEADSIRRCKAGREHLYRCGFVVASGVAGVEGRMDIQPFRRAVREAFFTKRFCRLMEVHHVS